MYGGTKTHQITFYDFNQSCGMQLNENDEWIELANRIDWDSMEKKYSEMFPSPTGRPSKPFRMALGALIIQKHKNLSDRKLVKEIAENPYLQYFIGLEKFTNKCPFTSPALVAFRKRLDVAYLIEINDMFLQSCGKSDEHAKDKAEEPDSETGNMGTQILDATCSPSNIEYPQDYALLSQARVKLEEMIDFFCENYGLEKPRTYRRIARKEYLALAKTKKRTAKKIRAFIRKHLGYVRRDLEYLEKFMISGYAMPACYIEYYLTIAKLYEQQKYMFDNKTHHVENRIVSISQHWIRPIVRGKKKNPVEFGAKYDISIDEKRSCKIGANQL